ncbi:hypothetical protein B0H13DRAFT_2387169 [Mycena leptocephala]|nr:hypothetical protein B0H13DRAFT_2387169 [Mycena leptocephala]
MTDEWPPVKFSQNDFASLEEIIEQYKEGNCERNSVIAALTTGIASICVVREIRCPDDSLILPYLERLDAFDRDKRLDDGPVFSRKARIILTRMEEDRHRRNNRRKMRRQKYDDVSGDEEENLSSYLLSMACGGSSSPAAASQRKETIFDDNFAVQNTFHGPKNSSSHHLKETKERLKPYDTGRDDVLSSRHRTVLCFRCGRVGHVATTCEEANPSRQWGEFVISANRNGLFRIVDNRPVCMRFNRTRCHASGKNHALHTCSLCGDYDHGALSCNRRCEEPGASTA